MASRLVITQKAEIDLEGIIGYIVNELGDISAAERFLDEIEARYGILAQNPLLYGECRQPLLKAAHYRKIVVGGYIMICRYDEEKDIVIIERFFSDLEDYTEKL